MFVVGCLLFVVHCLAGVSANSANVDAPYTENPILGDPGRYSALRCDSESAVCGTGEGDTGRYWLILGAPPDGEKADEWGVPSPEFRVWGRVAIGEGAERRASRKDAKGAKRKSEDEKMAVRAFMHMSGPPAWLRGVGRQTRVKTLSRMTVIKSAPATTCRLVAMYPEVSMTNPLP